MPCSPVRFFILFSLSLIAFPKTCTRFRASKIAKHEHTGDAGATYKSLPCTSILFAFFPAFSFQFRAFPHTTKKEKTLSLIPAQLPETKKSRNWKKEKKWIVEWNARASRCPSLSNPWRSPGSNRRPTPSRTEQKQPLYQLSQIPIFMLVPRFYSFVFTLVKSTTTTPWFQKLQCRLTAPLHPVSDVQKIKWTVTPLPPHMFWLCNCSGAAELAASTSSASVDLHGTLFCGCTITPVCAPRKWAPRCSFVRMVHVFAVARIHCYTGSPGRVPPYCKTTSICSEVTHHR